MPVTFFYPYPKDIARAPDLDFGDWRFWTSDPDRSRHRNWILRTALMLRRAGHSVRLSDRLPSHGWVVILPDSDILSAFFKQFGPAHHHLHILTVRADIFGFRFPLADADIVQNGCFADEKRIFFVPHWLQPGLIPRDPDRGSAIRTIAFKGGAGSLRDDFRSDRWHTFIESRGLCFRLATGHTLPPRWHDYEEVDLVLAVRPAFSDGGLRPEKPATKLCNAWRAGVPALLGPEYAFRELRQSPLDYIEVDSVEEAMQAVDRLLDDRALYRRMIEHGRKRAQAFAPERITERWAEVLFERLPEVEKLPSVRRTRGWPLPLRLLVNWIAMPPAPFELRKQAGYLYRQTRSQLSL